MRTIGLGGQRNRGKKIVLPSRAFSGDDKVKRKNDLWA
jgi:hypothetical protein